MIPSPSFKIFSFSKLPELPKHKPFITRPVAEMVIGDQIVERTPIDDKWNAIQWHARSANSLFFFQKISILSLIALAGMMYLVYQNNAKAISSDNIRKLTPISQTISKTAILFSILSLGGAVFTLCYYFYSRKKKAEDNDILLWELQNLNHYKKYVIASDQVIVSEMRQQLFSR